MDIDINAITEEEGRILADIARGAVAAYLKDAVKIEFPRDIPDILKQKLGVFISLKKVESGQEKSISSMGYPLPLKPTVEAVIDSGIAAAIRARVNGVESLDEVIIEVSLIGAIEPLQAERRASIPEQIRIGEDGIMIERGFHRALYLPGLAVEHGWDSEGFLSEGCVKAGLMPDAWLDEATKLYKFKVKVFR